VRIAIIQPTAVRATELRPYPKNSDTHDKVSRTPYPNSTHPAEVSRNGIASTYKRLSGSKMPRFLFVRHAHQISTKLPVLCQLNPARAERQICYSPPAHAPNRFPSIPGMLIRPLICGLQLYGGACSTNGLRMLTATTMTREME
jgi:hypothetical protein